MFRIHVVSVTLSLSRLLWHILFMLPSLVVAPAFGADVLLVDDDDNDPGVSSFYTSALDNLGILYDVWDTSTSGKPVEADLYGHTMVVWFTGDKTGSSSGPGSAGEAALATYLESGGCLFVSSQHYATPRGVAITPFMDIYLGIGGLANSGVQTTVSGQNLFNGLGPYSLSYPGVNDSDTVTPNGNASIAFSGNDGNAAVYNISNNYRTMFWGFPFEAIASHSRQQAMQRIYSYCHPPQVLLVDDDDNAPEVETEYTDVLDGIGISYEVWDTNNTDNEPDAARLENYEAVIWFTGDSYTDFAGPGSYSENVALPGYLNGGGCLVLISQDYLYARARNDGQTAGPLSSFMTEYLGLSSAIHDETVGKVTGQAPHFHDENYNLQFPFANFSDYLTPSSTAAVAFIGDQSSQDLGIYKDTSTYRTAFLAFPLEAIALPNEREAAMRNILNYCGRKDDPVLDYRFHRMWPTLNEHWYFHDITGLAVDRRSEAFYIASNLDHEILKYSLDGRLLTKFGTEGTGFGEIATPHDVEVDLSSEETFVYVSDSYGSPPVRRIQKFTGYGEPVAWPVPGAAVPPGGVVYPFGFDVDASGKLYVADGNDRIVVYDSNGNFLREIGAVGSGDPRVADPQDVAVDDDGYVYVIDSFINIKKFSPTGQYMEKWDIASRAQNPSAYAFYISADEGRLYVSLVFSQEILVLSDTGQVEQSIIPTAEGVATFPGDVEAGKNGTIMIAGENNAFFKYDQQGQQLSLWSHWSLFKDGWFLNPYDTAVSDESGQRYIYVVDLYRHSVEKFTEQGVHVWNKGGYGSNLFNSTSSISVDAANERVLVADRASRIQLLDFSGNIQPEWTIPPGTAVNPSSNQQVEAVDVDNLNGRVYVVMDDESVLKYSAAGVLIDQWTHQTTGVDFGVPDDIAVGSNGDVFITSSNGNIYRFNSAGNQMGHWAALNPLQTGVDPQAITTDLSGNVYVVDRQNHQILKYTEDGYLLKILGETGTGAGQMQITGGLDAGPDGKLYIADNLNARVQVLEPIQSLLNTKAIIAAGGGFYAGNHLWNATQAMTNKAYTTLRRQGLSKDQIYFLSPDLDVDLDGNKVFDDIDADATAGNLQYAIENWAGDAENVILYLTDHGGEQKFRISPTESVSSSELSGWLATLEGSISGKTLLIYDACKSGSFLPISGSDRIVISSTEATTPAYFTGRGLLSFSSVFWSSIQNGNSVGQAFTEAKDALALFPAEQIPLMDANNDDSSTSADITAVQSLYIGAGTAGVSAGPVIGGTTVPSSLGGGSSTADITATGVVDADGINRVWAVLYPPFHEIVSADSPIMDYDDIELLPAGGGTYTGTYDRFTSAGNYRVVISATDGAGHTTTLAPETLTVGSPLARRAMIVAGGINTDPDWPGIESAAVSAYQALKAQGYTDNDIVFYSTNTVPGVDQAPSLNSIMNALAGWNGTNTYDVVLYLVGSSNGSNFRLNPDSTGNETLAARQLDTWLDYLQQSGLPGKLTVIVDADDAGLYMGWLTAPAGMEEDRIRLASTIAGRAGFEGGGRVSWSHFFWGNMANGATLPIAHLLAERVMYAASSGQQQGWLDSNSDFTYDLYDTARILSFSLGHGILLAGDEPLIGSAWIDETGVDENPMLLTLWAQDITTTGAIADVWALVTPPDVDGFGGTDPVPEKVDLTASGTSYTANYSLGNPLDGTYTVTFYASDAEGAVSIPLSATATRKDIYEPDDTEPSGNAADPDSIVVDGPPQYHSFHVTNDEDWVRFTADGIHAYTITADPLGTEANVVLTVKYPDGTTTETVNKVVAGDYPLGTEVHITPSVHTGVYKIKVSLDQGGSNQPSDYMLSVTTDGGGTGSNISITGIVVGQDNNPVGFVTVKAEHIQSGATQNALSDPGIPDVGEIGKYKHTDRPDGNHRVTAIVDENTEIVIEPVAVSSSSEGPAIVNFTLDTDSDGDGVGNSIDPCPDNVDCDGDGLVDGAGGIVSVNTYDGIDADGDGYVDGEQDANDNNPDTDPENPDSDGDTFNDGMEVLYGSNPMDGADTPENNYINNGDINSDTRVDVVDVLFATRIVLGQYTPSDAERLRADVVPDSQYPAGMINAGDLLRIQRMTLGM